MKTLFIAEHDNKVLKPANFHTIRAARELAQKIDVLLIGYECEPVVQALKSLPQIEKILVADAPDYEHQLAENSAELIAEMAKNYDYILTTASTFGKNLLPRVAALLDVAMIGDVVKVISPDTFIRPIYAGNAFETVQTKEKIKLLTIRPTAFPALNEELNETIEVEKIGRAIPNHLAKFMKQELTVSTRPELTAARIIISGGRGLKSAENFKLLEKIADRLGAALGASRAAVDAGFAPNDYQVGQTGKVVAPELYIAVVFQAQSNIWRE